MDIKEIAYHEAGHAVVGYLFYQPIAECTIIPNNGRLGNTISNIPCPLLLGNFQNKTFAGEYFKIALLAWSGEYFQKKINNIIDEGGLVVDKGLLDIYCNSRLIKVLNIYKDEIMNVFFADEVLCRMVDDVAEKLLERKTLNESDIASILSCYDIDFSEEIRMITEKFHAPICEHL